MRLHRDRAAAGVAFACVLAALFYASAAGADSGPLINTTEPISFTYPACNGDVVPLAGTLHIVTVADTDGIHLRTHLDAHLTGIGVPSGRRYVLDQVQSAEINWGVLLGGNGAFTFTNAEPGQLVAQGEGIDVTVSVLAHITLSPDGTIRVDDFEFVVACA